MSNYSDVISNKIMLYYKEEYERENGAKSARATRPLATVSRWILALAGGVCSSVISLAERKPITGLKYEMQYESPRNNFTK